MFFLECWFGLMLIKVVGKNEVYSIFRVATKDSLSVLIAKKCNLSLGTVCVDIISEFLKIAPTHHFLSFSVMTIFLSVTYSL